MAADNAQNGGKWAVILCGGRGSRMGSVTDTTPKPLIPVHGKPIMWYILHALYKNGFQTIILPLGYKGPMVKSYVDGVSKELGLRVLTRDTGGDARIVSRINQVADLIPDGGDFFLLNSDTIFDFDIEAMYNLHRREDALLTLSSVEVISAWGLITMDGDRLASFDRERRVRRLLSDDNPGMYGLVNSGLAWLNKEALNHIDLDQDVDFESTLYPRIIDLGRAAHFPIQGSWFAIDTPKDLNIVNLKSEDRHRTGHKARAVRDKLAALPDQDDQ